VTKSGNAVNKIRLLLIREQIEKGKVDEDSMKNSKMKNSMLASLLGLTLLAPAMQPTYVAAEGNAKIQFVEFIGMPAPATSDEMTKAYSAASVKVTYTDGTAKLFLLSYKTLFKTSDKINGTPAGLAVDVNGKPIMDNTVADKPTPYISDSPDANSLLQVDGAPATGKGGNPLSLVTHYEYITANNDGKSAYGLIPASMSLTTIDQNKSTGELTAVNLKKIDFSGVDGLWIPCNGSLTPWNTHLGSEEYEPDARAFEADSNQTYVGSFVKNYYQDANKTGNPYSFGWLPEITVNKDNTTSVVKHYSMGRFSHELGKVAPDHRTVFFGDDGGNTMLFMYVADKAQDLSAGTLYAARWIQTSDQNGGSADLQWIKLGHATDSEIKAFIDKGIKFSDIFETADQDMEGFTKIKVYPSGKIEYLKVKEGMEQAAAFLEPRRFGAVMGATAEFNKMEGVAINSKDKKVYVAMSYVEKSMEKDAKGQDPVDHIQVKKIKAGVTYEMSMAGGQKDSSGKAIESDYVAVNMKGLVVGEDLAQADEKGNTAAVDKVANPDNLAYSEAMRTLFIGEDSGMHVNNYVWAYNIDTGKLSRIMSTPAGAEATGLQMVDDLNGFSYIMSNFQHPGDEMIAPDPLKQELDALMNKNFDNKRSGSVGYISGLPSLATAVEPVNNAGIILRDIAESKGAAVKWNDADRSVTVTKGSKSLTVRVGSATATVNGKTLPLPAPVNIVNDRLMFPAGILNDFLK
jgi:hypothetical protein